MNTFFISRKDIEQLPVCDRQKILADIEWAAKRGLWVSPRGEDWNEHGEQPELRLSQVHYMEENEAIEYCQKNSCGWSYVPATEW